MMMCSSTGQGTSGDTAAVGLIGGIGSGKSTVARMFAALEVPTLDLDDVGRRLTEPGQPGLELLVSSFGPRILQNNGALDRQRISSLTFDCEKNLKRLTDILHPLIWEKEKIWLKGVGTPYAIIEAVVLLESGAAGRMDAIMAVISKLELRRQRVRSRGHPPLADFESIVKHQCRDEERINAADYIIYNNGSLHELSNQVMHAHQLLLKRYNAAHTSQ